MSGTARRGMRIDVSVAAARVLLVLAAMRLQLLVVAALASGCLDHDHDIEVVFRVVDTTGAPRPEAITTCGGECDADSSGCFVPGTVAELADGDRLCTVPDAASGVWLTASIDGAHVEVSTSRSSDDRTLVLWTPTVSTTEVGDEIVVSWTPPPIVERVEPDRRRLQVHVHPYIGETWHDLDATSVALPLEDFEDLSAIVDLEAEQVIDGHTHYQWIDATDVPHTPMVPISRGAACTVRYRTTYPQDRVELVSYEAGACPLTDGEMARVDCGSWCGAVAAEIDLGAEHSIRRVRVRGSTGTLAVSDDGVVFTVVGATEEELAVPAVGRYVRVGDSSGLGEVSVFTP